MQTHFPMRTLWLVVCASAGCSFGSPDDVLAPDASADPVTDPPPTAPRAVCDREDAALRLCVDFRSPIADRSSRATTIAATAVSPMDRDGDPAAELTDSSTMHIGEAPALDIQDRLALDMWIRPTGTPEPGERFWILDNNTQYAASFTDLRKARCVIGSRFVDSVEPLPDDGKFHHIACTYDQTTLKVFVDGALSACEAATTAISSGGTSGLAIGANLSGPTTAPVFNDNFIGGIDDVRVWARTDLDICAIAGKTGCNTVCL